MPPKQKPNAYSAFCLENRDHWEAEKGKSLSMAELVQLCADDWNTLGEEQKNHYKELAKQRRQDHSDVPTPKRTAISHPSDRRLDSLRLPLCARVDPAEMENRERAHLNELLPFTGLEDLEVVVIDVECFQKVDAQDYSIHRDYRQVLAMPAEVCIGVYSMRRGLLKRFSALVVPDAIPLGMRLAFEESVERHRIPIEANLKGDPLLPVLRTKDHAQILKRIFCMLISVGCSVDVPIFATDASRLDVIGSLNWLRRSAERDRGTVEPKYAAMFDDSFLGSVLSLEMLVETLLSRVGEPDSISPTEMRKIFTDTRYDYQHGMRCAFHELEQADSIHCAYLHVSKALYALSVMLEPFYHFELTPDHHPPAVEVHNTDSAWPDAAPSWPQTEATDPKGAPQRNHGDVNGASNFYYDEEDDGGLAPPADCRSATSAGRSCSFAQVAASAANRPGSSFVFGEASASARTDSASGMPQRPPSAMSALSSSTVRSVDVRFNALAPFKQSRNGPASMSGISSVSALDHGGDDDAAESISARRLRREAADEFFDDDSRSNASSRLRKAGNNGSAVAPIDLESDSDPEAATDDAESVHHFAATRFDNRSVSSHTSWSSSIRTSASGFTDAYVNNEAFVRPSQPADDRYQPGVFSNSNGGRLPSMGRGRGRNSSSGTNK